MLAAIAVCVAGAMSKAIAEEPAGSPASLLEEGLYLERTLRQPEKAEALYGKVIATVDAPEAVRLEACLRLGQCLERTGRADEARKHYELVAERSADHPRLADRAFQRLTVISASDPAMLMPANTRVYVELVRPGVKIERFMASLKGLDEAGMDQLLNRLGIKRSLRNIRSLLSQAMREDMNRIDSLALGIMSYEDLPGRTDFKFLLVLHPGRSVSARGLLALMAQSTGEAIEGHGDVRLWALPDGQDGTLTFANLPNRPGLTGVMLLGKDRQVVCDAIDRWRQGAKANGLASIEEFRRQAAARRRDSAVLLYADVPAILARAQQVMAPDDRTRYEAGRELFALDAVERGMARVALLDDGVLFELSLMFNDRPNPFYAMLQTPPADRSLLRFVPTETAAAFLMSLGQGREKWEHIKAFFEQFPRLTQAMGGGDPLDLLGMIHGVESMTGLSIADDLLGNCRSLAIILPTLRRSSSDLTDSPAANIVLVLRMHRPDEFVRRLEESLLDQLRVGLEVTQIAGVETRVFIDTPTASGAAIAVARIRDVFLMTISTDMLERVLLAHNRGDVMERSDLGRPAVAAVPPSASKILLVRPELIVNDLRALDGQDPLALRSVRPVVVYTLEQPNQAAMRIEIGELTGLLNNAILAAGSATPASAPASTEPVTSMPATTSTVSSGPSTASR